MLKSTARANQPPGKAVLIERLVRAEFHGQREFYRWQDASTADLLASPRPTKKQAAE